MMQTKARTIKMSFIFLFLIIVVAVNFNILIHFFFKQHSHVSSANHITLATATVSLTLLLIFALFSYYRILEKRIIENEYTIDELVSKNDFFRLLTEKSNDMIHFNDEQGTIKYINPVTMKLLGYQAEELINKKARDFIHPDDRGAIAHDMQLAATDAKIAAREIRLLKKNGDWLDVEAKGFSFYHSGNQKYIGAVLRDISNRKKKEKLSRLKEEWEKTFNNMTDYISVHDKNFKVLRVNDSLCDFLQKEPQEIIGKYCYEVFHGTDKPIDDCPHVKSIETCHPVSMEVNDPGIGVPLQVTCSPFFNDKNEFEGSVHIARNITDRSSKQINHAKSGDLLPICASCKNIRNENNTWERVEEYFQKHCRVMFTHCICKKCQKKLYPEFSQK